MRFTLHNGSTVIAGPSARHKGFSSRVKAELAASEYADRNQCAVAVKDNGKTVYTARAKA